MAHLPRRAALRAASGALHAAKFGLEVLSDVTPVVRMTGRRRLPRNMSAGLLGAEVATWAAVSPSLLPRPWWVTAANVAIGQGFGHLVGSTAAFLTREVAANVDRQLPGHLTARNRRRAHFVLGAITVAATVRSISNQRTQAELVGKSHDRGPRQAVAATGLGVVGYGVLLLVGEGLQASVDQLSERLRRWMPPLLAWPLASAAIAGTGVLLSDKVLLRRIIHTTSAKAEKLNRAFVPGSPQPHEPERSGSPDSHEDWDTVGAKGRDYLSRGPRAAEIKKVMGLDEAREPIRLYAGFLAYETYREAAEQVLAEMDRTDAFSRRAVVIQMPSGTGWLNEYSVASYEFLTGGDCATVTLQYSYLQSVFAYVVDPQSPVEAAAELIRAVRERLDAMPADERPQLYLAGESLGAYAILDNFDDVDDLLAACDGAVLSGPPRMSTFTKRLRRDPGSLERVPIVDGGRHLRFASHPDHVRHDAFGRDFAHKWERPRVVIAQHPSDAIVWWDSHLLYRRPDWVHEPTPKALHNDTLTSLHWVPFISFWQIGLDQINTQDVPGGHGHNYFTEMFTYWAEVLGSQAVRDMSPELAHAMTRSICPAEGLAVPWSRRGGRKI